MTSELDCFHLLLHNNLRYWSRQASERGETLIEIDPGCECLARALELGFSLRAAWNEALNLLVSTRDVILRQGSAALGKGGLLVLIARVAAQAPQTRDPSARKACVVALEVVAQLRHRQGNLAAAESCYRQALALVAATELVPQDDMPAYLQAELGWFLLENEREEEGVHQLQEALATAEQQGFRRVQVRALTALGWYAHHTWDPEKAKEYLERALPVAEDLPDMNLLARVRLDLANACWRRHEDAQAERDCGCAIALAEQCGNWRLHAAARDMQAVLCGQRGDFVGALANLRQAERICLASGYSFELASVYQNLGVTHWDLRQLGLAESYFRQALALWQTLGQTLRTAEALASLAEIELDRGAGASAAEHLAGARRLVEQQRGHALRARWVEQLESYMTPLEKRLPPGQTPDRRSSG